MGFFGKLFEKKVCDFCGDEIGLLGNRKLEDGNMCKKCAAKLSPWFSDRRESTVEQIRDQLEYREANKIKVAAFNTTRTLGQNTKVLMDEDAGVFMVTSARDLEEANPDILAFSDVTGCELDIDEEEREIKRDGPDGKQVSYNPPRYKYYYNFYIVIHVRHPYFDEIRFRLNGAAVEIESSAMGGPRFTDPRTGAGRPGVTASRVNNVARMMSGFGSPRIDPERDVDYRCYRDMGEEIKEALLQVRQQARDKMAAATETKAAVTCPYCGATTTPDAAGCCEYCGGAVNG